MGGRFLLATEARRMGGRFLLATEARRTGGRFLLATEARRMGGRFPCCRPRSVHDLRSPRPMKMCRLGRRYGVVDL